MGDSCSSVALFIHWGSPTHPIGESLRDAMRPDSSILLCALLPVASGKATIGFLLCKDFLRSAQLPVFLLDNSPSDFDEASMRRKAKHCVRQNHFERRW